MHITSSLKSCKKFYINVAFINFSGVQLLLDTLKFCEKNNIKGEILTSTYLYFTDTKALEVLNSFENISLKIYDCDDHKKGFHSKAYIFEYHEHSEVIIGSSNITASAFKSNIEWNTKAKLDFEDEYYKTIKKEFYKLFIEATAVNSEFLDNYESIKNSFEKIEYKKLTSLKSTQKKLTLNHMQDEALKKLKYLRNLNETKSLAIAATGSGKTILSAMDVKEFNAKSVLFIVHRENILLDAKKSFENIIESKTCGLFTGNKKEIKEDYIFSTIQTISLNYELFSKSHFDYIVIDEAHHCTSPSYKKVLDYFEPKFLLGLTATANRMDGSSVFEIFDDNIACNIKLNDALKHNLVVPFHYFGISDLSSIDYENTDLKDIAKLSKLLNVNKRVDFIIDKMNYYSFHGKKRKSLAFCVSIEHAKYMSENFNKKNIPSTYLSSSDSIENRVKKINELQDDTSSLQVIFTVDIFNEGIDIPHINTVLFLRPTMSSIVFAQQLGRGLRKSKNKEFLTVLDFIGNHTKSFLVSRALLGESVIDKDSIKLAILNDFAYLQNCFICMDEVSKTNVLAQLDNQNFNTSKYLKEYYYSLKESHNNAIPLLCDLYFLEENNDELKFIHDSKSYVEFLVKVEKTYKDQDLKSIVENENFVKIIRFISYMLPIKRPFEFAILKCLLTNDELDLIKIQNYLKKYLDNPNTKTIIHSLNFLDFIYFDKAQISRYEKCIQLENNNLVKKSKIFEEVLNNKTMKLFIEDSINYALLKYEDEYKNINYGVPFLKLYGKYNMLNIALLCNFPKIHSSFRGSGFLKYEDDFFLFINVEKEKFTKASKYKNAFISNDTFTYSSKPSHSSDKGDGQRLISNKTSNVNLHIFVRKFAKVDNKTQDFIYLGLADCIEYWGEKPIHTKLRLREKLDDKLYEEFTKIPHLQSNT